MVGLHSADVAVPVVQRKILKNFRVQPPNPDIRLDGFKIVPAFLPLIPVDSVRPQPAGAVILVIPLLADIPQRDIRRQNGGIRHRHIAAVAQIVLGIVAGHNGGIKPVLPRCPRQLTGCGIQTRTRLGHRDDVQAAVDILLALGGQVIIHRMLIEVENGVRIVPDGLADERNVVALVIQGGADPLIQLHAAVIHAAVRPVAVDVGLADNLDQLIGEPVHQLRIFPVIQLAVILFGIAIEPIRMLLHDLRHRVGAPGHNIQKHPDIALVRLLHEVRHDLPALIIVQLAGEIGVHRRRAVVAVVLAIVDGGQPDAVNTGLL